MQVDINSSIQFHLTQTIELTSDILVKCQKLKRIKSFESNSELVDLYHTMQVVYALVTESNKRLNNVLKNYENS